MPVRIGDIAVELDPLHPEEKILSVWNRLQDASGQSVFPVVRDGVPIGLLRASDIAARLLAAAAGGASVLGTVGDLMQGDPVIADPISPVSLIAKEIADGQGAKGELGVLAADDGTYTGFVPADALFHAVATENAERASNMQILMQRAKAQKAATDHAIEKNSRFLAFVSHEIRTALTGTLGMADLLADAGLSEPYRQYAETLSDSGRHLERLLTDLLDLSRLDADKMPIQPEPFKLADFAHETRMMWSQEAGSRNVNLNVSCKAGANTRIEADAVRLRQILFNLVSNALKFSGGKKVDVVLDVDEGDAGSLGLQMTVADTGVGISEEDQERLFGIFEQAKSDTVHRYGGSGLGLAIAKGLADRMDGRITLESREGRGSVFTVYCPVRRAGPRLAVKNDRPKLGNIKLGQVLIVDDHEASRLVLTQALSEAGWRVDVVNTAEQGLRRASEIPYQAILLDLHLGASSGLKVARHLRRQEGPNLSAVLLAVTADTRETLREACRRAGFNDVLTKPIRPKDLVATLIDTLLAAEQSERVDDQLRRLGTAD